MQRIIKRSAAFTGYEDSHDGQMLLNILWEYKLELLYHIIRPLLAVTRRYGEWLYGCLNMCNISRHLDIAMVDIHSGKTDTAMKHLPYNQHPSCICCLLGGALILEIYHTALLRTWFVSKPIRINDQSQGDVHVTFPLILLSQHWCQSLFVDCSICLFNHITLANIEYLGTIADIWCLGMRGCEPSFVCLAWFRMAKWEGMNNLYHM